MPLGAPDLEAPQKPRSWSDRKPERLLTLWLLQGAFQHLSCTAGRWTTRSHSGGPLSTPPLPCFVESFSQSQGRGLSATHIVETRPTKTKAFCSFIAGDLQLGFWWKTPTPRAGRRFCTLAIMPALDVLALLPPSDAPLGEIQWAGGGGGLSAVTGKWPRCSLCLGPM